MADELLSKEQRERLFERLGRVKPGPPSNPRTVAQAVRKVRTAALTSRPAK